MDRTLFHAFLFFWLVWDVTMRHDIAFSIGVEEKHGIHKEGGRL